MFRLWFETSVFTTYDDWLMDIPAPYSLMSEGTGVPIMPIEDELIFLSWS